MKRLPCISYPDQLCEECLLGKQFRNSFPKDSNSRAKKPLELVHTDVCGPIKPSPLDNKNKVLKMRRALYGLKQAPRAWNSRINKDVQMEYVKFKDQIADIFTKLLSRVGSESSQVGAELTEPLTVDQVRLTVDFDFDHKNRFFSSVGEVANLLQRSRKEASVVEVEAEAEDEVEAVVMDEVGILTAVTSTTTRKEKAQQEAVGEAIQTRGTINLKEEPSLTIEVKVSYSSAIPLIQKVTSYTTRTTKSL
ncbi:hypothetical protein ACOSP7_006344 [Xanthoceras sorbifolium]